MKEWQKQLLHGFALGLGAAVGSVLMVIVCKACGWVG